MLINLFLSQVAIKATNTFDGEEGPVKTAVRKEDHTRRDQAGIARQRQLQKGQKGRGLLVHCTF